MTRTAAPVPIDLALQGGGSHGAYTWGVLDTLLQDPKLRIEGVSGTSAGALNAGVLATGYADGGAEGARAALEAFWSEVGRAGGCFGGSAFGAASGDLSRFNLDHNWLYFWSNQWMKLFTPNQLNPFGLNTLRDVTRRHVRDEALQRGPIKLFITATAVTTGQPEVFKGERLSVDALLASACLPQLFAPVEIDGVAYWDGGYSGNPAIWPLTYGTTTEDIVLVSINPLVRPQLPSTAAEIADRVNEITFNAGLVGELRSIDFVSRLIREERLDPKRYKSLRMHRIADDTGLAPLHPSSKMNTNAGFLLSLRELGRASAQAWLESDGRKVGKVSTLDIRGTYLGRRSPRPQH